MAARNLDAEDLHAEIEGLARLYDASELQKQHRSGKNFG